MIAIFHTDHASVDLCFLLCGPWNPSKDSEMAISAESCCWPFPELSGEWQGRSEKVGRWGVNGR